MGNVLKLTPKWVGEGVQAIDKLRLPCHLYTMDFAREDVLRRVKRVAIVQTESNIQVVEFEFSTSRHFQDVKQQVYGAYEQLFDAQEKFNELTTLIEQENFEYVGEFKCNFRNLHEEALNTCKFGYDVLSVSDFQSSHRGQRFCKVSALPNGFLCLLTVDPFGKVRLISKYKDVIEVASSLQVVYSSLVTPKGSQGAILEGIYDGIRFFVTKALFINGLYIRQNDDNVAQFNACSAECGLAKPYTMQTYEVAVNALDGLFSNVIGGLLVETDEGFVALCNDKPKSISFGANSNENEAVLYDDRLRALGRVDTPRGLNLAYRQYQCLALVNGHRGMQGVFI